MKHINCYIHIPFCTSKCNYCRFASFGGIKSVQVDLYINFLCNEINSSPDSTESGLEFKLDTIYFGGGTPGVLTELQFEKILNSLKKKYIFSDDIEISIESTPENVTKNNLLSWNKLGVNRLSMGVQTLNDNSLKEIGRAGKGDILEALNNINKIGFKNVSIDFIIGLPFVKPGEIISNLDLLINKYNFIKHISIYMLEEYYEIPETIDSSFENIIYPDSWDKLGIKEDEYLVEYENISNTLKNYGFNKYEISNYAKPGYNCKHNEGYWNHKENLAFGLGAFGFINNVRFSNSEKFIEYYGTKNILKEKLSEEDLFIEKIMFNIRTKGINKSDLYKLNEVKINNLMTDGYLKKKNTKIQLTSKGVLVLDYILSEIL